MKDTRATVFTEWALILSYSKAISYPPRVSHSAWFFFVSIVTTSTGSRVYRGTFETKKNHAEWERVVDMISL